MWAVFMALGLVGGLVKVAFGQATEPTIKPAWRKYKLTRLSNLSPDQITLDQAEDGRVLAREFDDPTLEGKFAVLVARLKTRRDSTQHHKGPQ